jgi:hypothetical protein
VKTLNLRHVITVYFLGSVDEKIKKYEFLSEVQNHISNISSSYDLKFLVSGHMYNTNYKLQHEAVLQSQ